MKLKIDNKGISLPMTIGLLLLLIVITTTINELVIRALRASQTIEASDKAYFAAEGGIENALYELSAHSAGYETGYQLGQNDVRNDDFTENVAWRNEWEIKNKGLNTCSNLDGWESGFEPDYCGTIHGNEKLVLNLFSDNATSLGVVGTNAVSTAAANISTLNVGNLTIKFRLPKSVVSNNPNAFLGATPLKIDNDGDYESGVGGLNEDGEGGSGPCAYSGGINVDDDDCDGLEDEDSSEDPVFIWRLVDESGNSFQPLRGCQGESHPSHNDAGATLCEKNFITTGIDEVSLSLSESDKGVDQDGSITTLQNFLSPYGSPPKDTEKLQMEILAVAPMEAVNENDQIKVPIPYFEYGMDYNAGPDTIPSTFFAVKSDGYFRDFKQSITTNVTPEATTRLLDLTIIQQ